VTLSKNRCPKRDYFAKVGLGWIATAIDLGL